MKKEELKKLYKEIEKEYREYYGIQGHPDTLEYSQMWDEIDREMSRRCGSTTWENLI